MNIGNPNFQPAKTWSIPSVWPSRLRTERDTPAYLPMILLAELIRIDDGDGEPIVDYAGLSERFGICHSSIRQATMFLANAGLVVRKYGFRSDGGQFTSCELQWDAIKELSEESLVFEPED